MLVLHSQQVIGSLCTLFSGRCCRNDHGCNFLFDRGSSSKLVMTQTGVSVIRSLWRLILWTSCFIFNICGCFYSFWSSLWFILDVALLPVNAPIFKFDLLFINSSNHPLLLICNLSIIDHRATDQCSGGTLRHIATIWSAKSAVIVSLRHHGDHDRGGSAEPDVGRGHAGGAAGDAGRPQRGRVGGQRRRGRGRGHGRAGPGQQRLAAVEDTHPHTLIYTQDVRTEVADTHTHDRFTWAQHGNGVCTSGVSFQKPFYNYLVDVCECTFFVYLSSKRWNHTNRRRKKDVWENSLLRY